MRQYVVVMDVSGEVDQKVIDAYDLKFIPMQYSLGDEMRTSYGPEKPEILKKFYDGQRSGDLTKTSQITPFMYEEYFSEFLDEGYCVLYLALSSGLSATYSAACVAQKSLKEKYPDLDVYPIDSKAATGGMSVLIETALKNQKAGMSIEENRDDLLSKVPHIKNWFMVDDLDYLKRGGRISSTTAFAGKLLNIKPILRIDAEGKLTTIAKKRGNKLSIQYLFDIFKQSYDESIGNTVYICDADNREVANGLAELVKQNYPNVELKQETLCPIIGAHTGPGMIIICHYGNEPQK